MIHVFLPHEQVQNAKIECVVYCRFQCSKFKKQLPPPRCPFPSTVALLRPRGPRRRVPLSQGQTNCHGCARFSEVGGSGRRVVGRSKVVVVVRRIARALPKSSSFPTPADRLPLEESELDVDMSNWLNFRRFDFVPVSGGDTVSQVVGSHRGVDVNASSRCLRSPSGSGYTCKAGLASGHTLPHRDHL
jgi:hypothetical protein